MNHGVLSKMGALNMKHKDVSEVFDEHGQKYNSSVNEALGFTGVDVDFFTRVKVDYLFDLLDKRFGKNSKPSILDIGCGVGNFHRLLATRLDDISGVDISKSSIDIASVNNPEVNYKVYEGERLPYEDQSFDVTLAVCVMHHVPVQHWQGFADEMKRVTKKSGLAIVFEHNPFNPLTMKVVNDCPFDEDAVLLSSKKTRKLFQKSDFDQIDRSFIISVPPINKFMRRIDTLFSAVPLGAQYYVASYRDR